MILVVGGAMRLRAVLESWDPPALYPNLANSVAREQATHVMFVPK